MSRNFEIFEFRLPNEPLILLKEIVFYGGSYTNWTNLEKRPSHELLGIL